MHANKRRRLGISQSCSMIGKVDVMGLLQRHPDASTVRVSVVKTRRKHELEQTIDEHVDSARPSTPMPFVG
jgi:hypothetical protein